MMILDIILACKHASKPQLHSSVRAWHNYRAGILQRLHMMHTKICKMLWSKKL
jgi:hypothetical protein